MNVEIIKHNDRVHFKGFMTRYNLMSFILQIKTSECVSYLKKGVIYPLLNIVSRLIHLMKKSTRSDK